MLPPTSSLTFHAACSASFHKHAGVQPVFVCLARMVVGEKNKARTRNFSEEECEGRVCGAICSRCLRLHPPPAPHEDNDNNTLYTDVAAVVCVRHWVAFSNHKCVLLSKDRVPSLLVDRRGLCLSLPCTLHPSAKPYVVLTLLSNTPPHSQAQARDLLLPHAAAATSRRKW